ncbi:14639_t:CDS:2, partial [Acaulospora colombiana]
LNAQKWNGSMLAVIWWRASAGSDEKCNGTEDEVSRGALGGRSLHLLTGDLRKREALWGVFTLDLGWSNRVTTSSTHTYARILCRNASSYRDDPDTVWRGHGGRAQERTLDDNLLPPHARPAQQLYPHEQSSPGGEGDTRPTRIAGRGAAVVRVDGVVVPGFEWVDHQWMRQTDLDALYPTESGHSSEDEEEKCCCSRRLTRRYSSTTPRLVSVVNGVPDQQQGASSRVNCGIDAEARRRSKETAGPCFVQGPTGAN